MFGRKKLKARIKELEKELRIEFLKRGTLEKKVEVKELKSFYRLPLDYELLTTIPNEVDFIVKERLYSQLDAIIRTYATITREEKDLYSISLKVVIE